MTTNPQSAPIARPKRGSSRTGLAVRIRDYLRDHPGITARAVAEALGANRLTVGGSMSKMSRRGLVTATAIARETSRNPLYTYTLAREPSWARLTPDESRARRLARQKGYQKAATLRMAQKRQAARALKLELGLVQPKPKPVAERVQMETYEQFLARGGKCDILTPCGSEVDYRRRGNPSPRRGGAM